MKRTRNFNCAQQQKYRAAVDAVDANDDDANDDDDDVVNDDCFGCSVSAPGRLAVLKLSCSFTNDMLICRLTPVKSNLYHLAIAKTLLLKFHLKFFFFYNFANVFSRFL